MLHARVAAAQRRLPGSERGQGALRAHGWRSPHAAERAVAVVGGAPPGGPGGEAEVLPWNPDLLGGSQVWLTNVGFLEGNPS